MNAQHKTKAALLWRAIGAALLGSVVPSEAAGSFPMQARTWDIEMTVPAGAYRASKQIDLTGGGTEKIEPGAFLEGIAFAGVKDGQHWEVRGATLRKVQIAGQLGVSLDARDSVLEECSFFKNTGWFLPWWGTHWTFNNCIFTKRFAREDFSPGDYAVHAERCTFYNVKLPPVGMKENPAGYLQKGEMGFVKCRFIQCDVPETFLAGTVDCLFEGCQFPSKRHAWPKETTPIRVNAYFSGLGAAPKAFINGPLTVQFSPAPAGLEAGSSLPHSQSAGRVTLAGQRDPAQFTMIGAVSKKASEIPFSEEPASALPPKLASVPALPPIPGVPSTPAPAAASEVRSVEDLMRSLPLGIELFKAGELNVAGVDAANQWLAKTFANRPAALQITFDLAQAYNDEGYAFKAMGRSRPIITRGLTLSTSVTGLFRADAAGPLVRAVKGNNLSIRGVVQKAVLEGRGRTLELVVTVAEAQTQ